MAEIPPTRQQQRRWLPCGCLLAVFLICVFVPLTGYVVWSFRASRAVDVQLAKVRAAGLPTESAELDGFYRIEAGTQDATRLYLEAQQQFSGSFFEDDCRPLPIVGDPHLEIPPPGQPWAEQQAVELFLDDYGDGLTALHQAAAMGGAARFPLEFDEGLSMLLPHTQDMRTCARMLALEAHVKAHQGDAAGAAKSIVTLATIGNSLENQPILISQLVRMAIHGIAVDLVDQQLPYVNFSDQDLVKLQQVFRQDDFKAGVAHALVGERVMGTELFKNPSQAMGDAASPASRLVRGSNEDLAFYLKIQNDLQDAVQLDYPAIFPAVDAVTGELKSKITTPFGRVRYVLSGLTLPAVDTCVIAAARVDGINRCIDTAIAVERYRRRAGELPKSLEVLVPEFLPAVPTDPYDGKPIRYVVQEDAYLVYVCGRDRLDQGGLDDEQRSDEVIRIERKSAGQGSKSP